MLFKVNKSKLINCCVVVFMLLIHLGLEAKNPKTVLKGTDGPVGSVNGIDFDKFSDTKDKLYGCSTLDSKVFVINTCTGELIDEYGPADGVVSPDDVVVGPDGNIYFTDTLAGLIARIDPSTRTLTPVAFDLPLINSIRFSENGTQLFAGQCFNPGQNGLWEIDLTEGNNHRLISDTLDVLCSLNSFEHKNGVIYGPRVFTGDVVRVDPVSGQVLGVVSSGFVNPGAVQFDSEGRLFILDSGENKLYVVDHPDLDNQAAILVADLPGDRNADNLAIDIYNNNNLFVSSLSDGYIIQLDPFCGTILDFIKDAGPVLPTGITISSQGQFLVSDFASLREVDIKKKKIVKSTYAGKDSFISPFSVASFDDHVVVCNWLSNAIQIWDHNNSVPVANISPNHTPLNVLEFQGNVIAAEFDSESSTATIVQYEGPDFLNSTTLLTLPLSAITGLATDGSVIWASDSITGVIYRLEHCNLSVVASNLSTPEGIALDLDGQHLLVMEAGEKRLVSVDLTAPAGDNVATITDGLNIDYSNAFSPPFFWVSSVVVDPVTNDIVYTVDADRGVERFKR